MRPVPLVAGLALLCAGAWLWQRCEDREVCCAIVAGRAMAVGATIAGLMLVAVGVTHG